MAKSKIKLMNGEEVNIEGSPEEIVRIISLYSGQNNSVNVKEVKNIVKTDNVKNTDMDVDQVLDIVNTIKECDESDSIEKSILDRSSLVDRIILPLYIANKYLKTGTSLTTGEISKILIELGISIAIPNVSNTIAGSAKSYVMGDKTRKRGQSVKYRISRRGITYLESVLNDSDK
jgi:hypothetical protein